VFCFVNDGPSVLSFCFVANFGTVRLLGGDGGFKFAQKESTERVPFHEEENSYLREVECRAVRFLHVVFGGRSCTSVDVNLSKR
uniref:Uncharacterized protein n=1 Tax=Ciona savignyi TaxID=51511 RepID=H2Z833_CIOSA